jgi:hypothetical protein
MKANRICLLLVFCLCSFLFRATATVYYVSAANSTPAAPFTSWATAATNIEDAINFTTPGDTVLVTNGVYAYGGLAMEGNLTNRVALTNAITVQSVNGPRVTTILGAGATNGSAAVRCAWLTNGATLAGFTLTAGATQNSGDSVGLESGGGVWCASSNAFVENCVVVSNTAYAYGSGVYRGSLSASLIISNATAGTGGAAYGTVLNDCTIVSNANYGVFSPLAMTNCIIYFNGPANNYGVSGSAYSHCCTTPALAGVANITSAPQLLADGAHLATNSPCIGAGVGVPNGTDIFGNAWSNPPSIGCAEWSPAPAVLMAPATQFPLTGGVAIGVAVGGQPPFTCWWTKDGAPVQADGNHSAVATTTLLINNFALSDAGGYQVVVSNFAGMATSVIAQVSAHCVARGGAALPPYSGWTSAATNIQDAINIAAAGDVILVTNGLYAFGGVVMDRIQSNRVALTQALMVQSVNGPWVTTIQGGNRTNGAPATRCAWLTNGAALVGFTLEGVNISNGNENGGGVWCAGSNAMVANCIICSNFTEGEGGGAYSGTLRNCAVFGNWGDNGGGGTAYSVLNNCTVIGNISEVGGGIFYSPGLTNCIVYYNSSPNGSNIYASGPASYCCTYPLPSVGVGNITNPPQLFVDSVHLFASSPCVGAGTNLGASTDIDGQPWNQPPAIGCSEAPIAPVAGTPVIQFGNSPGGIVISAAITGAGQLSYWWIENGIPVPGSGPFTASQTAILTETALTYADAGAYQLVVSNSFGVVTSAVAQVVMHCVALDSTNPVSPYLTWGTAATNIQTAIAAAAAGDIVLVTNGVYATGGISMDGVITNRVTVNKAILVQSVNGASTTVIQGAWDTASINGPGAIRCVWMTNNAMLSGFTVLGGATRAVASVSAGSGGGIIGTATSLAANCVILGNSAATYGGGAFGLKLIDCVLATNSVVGNPGTGTGGAAYNCGLKNCSISANFALSAGGGTAYGSLTNCAVTGNSAGTEAGGVYYGSLVNCTVTRNNSLSTTYDYSGGAAWASFVNSIVYDNGEANSSGVNTNYYECTFTYSCSAPQPAGAGNIGADPQFIADGIHLSPTSPCIGAGNESVVSGTDIDGQSWNNPPSMGCDEWQPQPVIATQPAFQVGVPLHGLTGGVLAAGATPAYLWTVNGVAIQADGHYSNSSTTNFAINDFGPADAGAYQVVVTNAYGAVTSAIVQVVIHAVNAAGANPVPPFSTWATAATNIQDAVNVSAGGDIVLVTNGLYANGGLVVAGTLTNRVALTQPIMVTSVNGYAVTTIQGAWDPTSTNGPEAVRCAYITNGAVLNGFTLCNGATLAGNFAGGPSDSGGGIYCPFAYGESGAGMGIYWLSLNGQAVNCVLSNNSAIYGGGIANGTLNNSLIFGNQADYGGGAYSSTLVNCTVVNNTGLLPNEGAGVLFSSGIGSVLNSIVLANYDATSFLPDNYPLSTRGFAYSCSSPLPSGTGNVNIDPQFLDWFHLAVTSPCIGAGSVALASGYDLDGEPWNNPPSMGCDEVVPADLVGPLSVNIASAWTNLLVNRLGSYSGMFTGRASWVQWDFGDGVTVSNTGSGASHEWTNAGNYTVTFTAYNNDNPQGVATNLAVTVEPLAVPQLQSPVLTANGIQFQFGGQTNATYTIQYSTNLVPPVAWQNLTTIYYNTHGTLQISDAAATNATRFYRILVQ